MSLKIEALYPALKLSIGMNCLWLVAEDEAENSVVIEKQSGKSEHEHLGRLSTCLAAIDAKMVTWIASGRRPEHVAGFPYGTSPPRPRSIG